MIIDRKCKDGVTMAVGLDYASGNHSPHSAIVDTDVDVSFRVVDPFAAYLAARCNDELAAFLKTKAKEIREFLARVEARLTL